MQLFTYNCLNEKILINYYIHRLLFIFIILFSASTLFSQINIDSLKQNKYYRMAVEAKLSKQYVRKIEQKYSVGPVFSSKTYSFLLTDRWGIGNPILYYPNVNNRLGLRASYKSLGGTITFQLPTNEFIYGKTKSLNLALNFQLSFLNWGTNFYFLRNKGLYIHNANEVASGWISGTPYPTRQDLIVTNMGFSTQMIFTDRFSIKAALDQSEKQLKSAGGFSLGAALNYNQFRADSNILTKRQMSFYKDVDSLVMLGVFTASIAPGYAYTYVYDDIFVSGVISIGIGHQIQVFKLNGPDGGIRPGIKLTGYLNYQVSAGYNSEKYFAALIYNVQSLKTNIKDSKLTFGQKGISVSAGIRFN